MTSAAKRKTLRTPPKEVLDAAAACFMEKGYAATSLDDVARFMGATKGRIYHYFASKSDLMHAVRKHAMEINFAAIRPAYETSQPPREKFAAMAEAHAMSMLTTQAYQKALFDNLHVHITSGKHIDDTPQMREFIAERREFENMFRDVLIAGQDSQDFEITTLSYALHTVLTILNATLYWYSPRPNETDADRRLIAQELVAMALLALGTRETSFPFQTKGTSK